MVVKRTALASVWRWMKRAFSGAREQALAGVGADLDEIAEHVVVLDAERADVGLGGVARLQAGDDAAALVAELARLVEVGAMAVADEAAVALQMRQVVGERRRRARRPAPPARAASAGARLGDLGRQRRRRRCASREPRGDGEPVADRGEVARAAAVERQARQRARRDRAPRRASSRMRSAPRGIGEHPGDRVEAAVDRRRDRSRARPGGAPGAARRRR